jgi:hypothetical protein
VRTMSDELPDDPVAVWRLIERADELVKYAQNRDPAAAHAQARDVLNQAASAAAALSDPGARQSLSDQIRTRLSDLAEKDPGAPA